jgi:molybdopterin molybdotransferase
MLSVEAARQTIVQALQATATEVIPFDEAAGRVLAEDVIAEIPVPPFTQSAMDGFAVRAADTLRASAVQPVRLQILGTVGAGHLAPWSLTAGAAIRIMTGAPLPHGADAVIKREDTQFTAESVTIFARSHPNDHIIPIGRDIPQGTALLRAGEVITAGTIGLLASLGKIQVCVHRRPRVGLLALGDELVPPHVPPAPGEIRVSNLYAAAASVHTYGGIPYNIGIGGDDLDAMQQALDQTGEVELFITLGGSQRGDFDFVDDLLSGPRGALVFRDTAANYVRSTIFGRFGPIPLCGLPGSPVASFVAFETFVRSAIWKLAGRRTLEPARLQAAVSEPLPATKDRAHFQPVWVKVHADGLIAIPLQVRKAPDLPPQTLANGLIYRTSGSPACQAGERVWVDVVESALRT